VLAVFLHAREGGGDHAADAADQAGHAVQVVDAGRVVQLELALEEGREVDIAGHADGAGDTAEEKTAVRLDDEIGAAAHGDAAGEGGVLQVDHAELVVRAEDERGKVRHDARRREREDRVDDDAVLRRADGEGAVEAGPVHPEEERADHGKRVADGRAALAAAVRPLRFGAAADGERASKTKVSPCVEIFRS
jgi:hypothetical protein